MKQTAVEWLGLQLNMVFTDITEEQWNRAEKLFQQAKEIERQQIIKAYDEAEGKIIGKGEQYYKETFNK
jgi:hypothetical protein